MPIPAGGYGDADRLATVDDLGVLLTLSDGIDTAKATLLLECATAIVQGVAEQRIVQVVNDAMVLDLDEHDGGPYLVLPERPVTAVTSVLIGATSVTGYTPQLGRARLWRPEGWRSPLLGYVGQPSTVTVVHTHGYPPGHQKLQLGRSAVLGLIAGVYDNPEGRTRVQIDDYSAMYEAMSTRMEASEFLIKALRRQYGRPPTGSVKLLAGRP